MLKKVIFSLILIFCLSIVFSTCKRAPAKKGFTDTTINIGQWGPQTGPAALWGSVARGTVAYFKMINDEGGIHGRKIVYSIRDDGYQPPRTKVEVKKLVEREGIFAFVGGVGTATGMAVKKYLADNKIPWVSPVTGSTHWAYPPSKYIFAMYPVYCAEAGVLIDYAVNKIGKKKIAIFYQNDDYGKLGLYGAELALEKHGLKLAESVSAEITDTDLSSQALRLKKTGADIVLLWVLPKHGAIILGASAKIGFKPQFMTTSTLSDFSIMYKITKGLWKDMIFCNFAELPDSKNPLMKKYRAAWKRYAPNERWGVFYYAGFLFAEPLIEGLKKCGRDLSVEKFIKAMESIKYFQGIGPDITYGPGMRQGANKIFLSQCISEKKSRRLTGWMASDIDIEKVIERSKR